MKSRVDLPLSLRSKSRGPLTALRCAGNLNIDAKIPAARDSWCRSCSWERVDKADTTVARSVCGRTDCSRLDASSICGTRHGRHVRTVRKWAVKRTPSSGVPSTSGAYEGISSPRNEFNSAHKPVRRSAGLVSERDRLPKWGKRNPTAIRRNSGKCLGEEKSNSLSGFETVDREDRGGRQ